MNDLTREIVKKIAKENKRLAARNGSYFRVAVEVEHWAEMIAIYGVPLKERALSRWRRWHPEQFDDEGYLRSYEPEFDYVELRISEICVRILERKVAHDPALRLDDWGDYPVRLVKPQMEMF